MAFQIQYRQCQSRGMSFYEDHYREAHPHCILFFFSKLIRKKQKKRQCIFKPDIVSLHPQMRTVVEVRYLPLGCDQYLTEAFLSSNVFIRL